MTTYPFKRVHSLAILFLIAPQYSTAYETYSTDGSTGNCADCHGDFRANNYVSFTADDGAAWGNDLMGGHLNFGISCAECHSPSGRSPVYLNPTSDPAGDSEGLGCVGCHGRIEDITQNDGAFGGPGPNWGDGLRAHHASAAGISECAVCHTADAVQVGEDVPPQTFLALVIDPCNEDGGDTASTGNFGAVGLDNDGDALREPADPDCQAAVPTPGDINFDGRADIVWRNSSTGQNWAYLMNGSAIDSSFGINTVSDQAWQIVGNGDYDGDGDADLLWRNTSNGQNWMYLMQDGAISSSVSVNTVGDQAWQVVGNGDYDGDGDSDILWRNSSNGQNWLYLMNGSLIDSSLALNTVADQNWQVVGNGDYDGDDDSDILWRNSSTGQNWMYLMQAGAINSSVSVNTVADQAWQVAGSGDYDGDGDSDILWRNNSNGQNWMYLMNGAGISSSESVNTVADPTNWKVEGSGDYNGDGKADILWRNGSTGQNWMYLMNGSGISASENVNTVVAGSWHIVNVD